MHEVFISYAGPDRAVAEDACRELESRGVKAWIAPRDVYEGQPYAECIVRALREAKLLVLIYSAHANASGMVMRELECAASLAKPILPIRIQDVPPCDEMRFFVGKEHWLDAVGVRRSEHWSRLVEAVRRISGAGPQPTAGGSAASAPTSAQQRSTPSWVVIAAGLAVACLGIAAVAVLILRGQPAAGSGSVSSTSTSASTTPAKPEAGAEAPAQPAQPAVVAPPVAPSVKAPDPVKELEGLRRCVALPGAIAAAIDSSGARLSGVVLNNAELEALRSRLLGSKLDAGSLLAGVRADAPALARLLRTRLKDEGFDGADVRTFGTSGKPETLRIEMHARPGKGAAEARAVAREYVSNDGAFVTIAAD